MKVSESIRNIIFWLVDFIKGSKVRNHYNDIKSLMEDPEAKESIRKQYVYLNDLLVHASNSSEFYKNIDPSDLQNFPIIDKEIMKSFYKKFQSKKYIEKKSIKVSTSGSTGAPFTVYQDLNKKKRNNADIIYFSELAGFKIGYKLFYLRFWNMFKKKNKMLSFIQNVSSVDVFDLSSETIDDLINTLVKNRSNKAMIGYVSSFDKICKYLDSIGSKKIDANMRSVIGISEYLPMYTKLAVKKYFNVAMVSRYSNSENGMFAQQSLDQEYFKINWASYYIEILDLLDDRRVAHGILGRIVITDLFNYNTPMIRYDTGDIGVMEYVLEDGHQVLVLTKVEGRKLDIIRSTSGEVLSTSILLVFNKYTEIIQRQIIQKTSKEYLFRLQLESHHFEKEKEFRQEFKEYLGEDAIIILEYVTEIPSLPSGKQRAIINELVT